MSSISLEAYQERVEATDPIAVTGRVVEVVGLTIEATGPPATLKAEILHV